MATQTQTTSFVVPPPPQQRNHSPVDFNRGSLPEQGRHSPGIGPSTRKNQQPASTHDEDSELELEEEVPAFNSAADLVNSFTPQEFAQIAKVIMDKLHAEKRRKEKGKGRQTSPPPPSPSPPGSPAPSDNSDPWRDWGKGDTPAPPRRFALSATPGTNKPFKPIKLPDPPKFSGRGKWTKAIEFDNWVEQIIEFLENAGYDRDDTNTMLAVGHYMEGAAKQFHSRWKRQENPPGLAKFFPALRKFCLPPTSTDDLWNEFEKITQVKDGRVRKIMDVANDIAEMKEKLPDITHNQMYNKLRDAMDSELRAATQPLIKRSMTWDQIVEIAVEYDSALYEKRKIKQSKAKNKHNKDTRESRNHNQGSANYNNPARHTYRHTNTRDTRNYIPKQATQSKFKKLTPHEKEELAKRGACFYCRQEGHRANNCPNKKRISSAATSVQEKISPPEISTAAQTLKKAPVTQHEEKKTSKKNSYQPRLKSADPLSDHLLVSTKINGHPAKTLVDHQTTGGDLISSKFCTTYNIPQIALDKPITVSMTVKGSRGSCLSYVKVKLDWIGHQEERIFFVVALSAWDVILGHPALSTNKAIIDVAKGYASIKPHYKERFQLQPWNPKEIKDHHEENSLHEKNFQHDQQLHNISKIISAAATEINEAYNPFDDFPELFPKEKPVALPPLREINHEIRLKDPNLPQKPVPIKPKEKFLDQLYTKLVREEESGRVYKAQDTSACSLFMIPKNDKPNEARFLHDLRARNDNTIPDPTPIPDQKSILNQIARHPYRSKIDLSDGYHNVRIIPDHEKYTSFITPFGTYRTRVMQQGDCNAPATFMKVMNHLFRDLLGKTVYVYLDDIFIFSHTYQDHIMHVKEVLTRLQQHKFFATKSKSQFLPSELHALGHVITKEGLKPEEKKINEILDWPTPPNRKSLQSFMGLVNYLSQFLPHLATTAAPLTEMCGATAAWEWRPLHDTSFQQCKDLVSAGGIIKPLSYTSDEPIYLITDASTIGTGAWVGQGPTLDKLRPAGFHSRKFNPAQQNYTTFNKELLAIVDALEHFRPILTGTTFTILTDHKPLITFMLQYDLQEKQARWQNTISQFDCKIQYLGGDKNVIADALSRVFKNPQLIPSRSDFINSKVDNYMYTPSQISAAQTLLQLSQQPSEISSFATTRSQTKDPKMRPSTSASTSSVTSDTLSDTPTTSTQRRAHEEYNKLHPSGSPAPSTISHSSPQPGWVYPENGKAYYAGIPVEGQDEDWESIPILERERAPSPPAPPRPTPILTPEAAMDPKEHRLLHWTGCFINP
ncbi:MAG TPA: reverse transcriptase domain-containing protein [Amoebophilaceae bacterium]|nr:reverse transcriptase domain-containing protein [Amoebophilaceae bacterium]